jgi:hypothetical protein
MWRTFLRVVVLVSVLVASPSRLFAAPIVIDFEGLDDLTSVGSLIPGVTFSNATVLTAGLSLNEFDFPPRSGSNVVFDDGGAMRLDFAAPVLGFSAYFTYAAFVTVQAFDSSNLLLGAVSSAFFTNTALSGDVGSSPNELLSLSFDGISSLIITGDPGGGSFILDDVSYEESASVPEPSTLLLLGTGLAVAVRNRLKRRRDR